MSSKGYKRTITLDFDYTQVKDGVPAVSRNMKTLDATFKKSSLEIQKFGKESEQLRLKQDMLTQKIGLQTKKVEELRKQYEQSSEKSGEHSKRTENLKKEYINAEIALTKFQNQLEDTNKEIAKQSGFLGEAITKIDDFKAQAKEAGVDIDKMADSFIKVGTVLVGIAASAAVMRTNFDTEMAKVRTIADTSIVSFKALEDGVLKLSNEFNLPATEMADSLYEVVSASTKTEDSLTVLRNSSLLAKTGFTDAKTAVDILTSFTNAYNLSISDQTELVNKLIVAQKEGKFTIDELGASFGQISGLASTAKVPIDDLLAAIAGMTSSGVGASESITGLRQVISAVLKPTSEATKEADKLGLRFNAAALSSKGLSGFLDDVSRASRGNTESIAKLFGSVEAFNSIAILTGTSADKFNSSLKAIKDSSNAANTALKDIKTPGEELSASINRMKNSLIDAGDAFAPVISFLADFISAISNVSTPVIIFSGVIGGLLLLLGGLVKTYTLLKSATVALTAAKSALAIVQGLLAGTTAISSLSMTQFLGIILLVAAAIAIIIGLIMMLTGNFDRAKKATDDLAGSVKSVTSDLGKLNSTAISVPTANRNSVNDSMTNLYNGTQSLPQYAYGTSNHPGGLALVGERGPEIVDMPKGSKVYTASETRQMLNGLRDSGQGEVTIINLNIDIDKVNEVYKLISVTNDLKQQKRAMTGKP